LRESRDIAASRQDILPSKPEISNGKSPNPKTLKREIEKHWLFVLPDPSLSNVSFG
jgi:hypothetical protein